MPQADSIETDVTARADVSGLADVSGWADVSSRGEPTALGAHVIAVVDDDKLIGETLVANLEELGFRAIYFDNGPRALAYAAGGGPMSAMLLDWTMPDMDGQDVLRRLRAQGTCVPVLFLTGHSPSVFEAAARADGAVDFVDKGQSFSIIVQRLKLALAGAQEECRASATPPQDGLHVDEASGRVYWRGAPVNLNPSEGKIAQLLATHAGADVTYRAIYDRLCSDGIRAGAGEGGYQTYVRAIVKRIRQAFRDVDAAFDMIKNDPGFGYRWSP